MNTGLEPIATARADDVIALLREVCFPLSSEPVALEDALGRVLRETVCAPEDQPAFDRSAVDGFAVRLDDAREQFHLVDEIRAGDWKPRQLQPGECVRIATGAAVPGEDLQVVMKEAARVEGHCVRVARRDADRHIRFRGEDARVGQVLVEAGTTLQPGTLALLASVGRTMPRVTRQPRILHVVTGNEIVPPGQIPPRGWIRDANSPLVAAFLRQQGIGLTQVRAPEDAAQALSLLRGLLTTARSAVEESLPGAVPDDDPTSTGQAEGGIDLLLISGGASVGDHDFTRQLLVELGYTIRVNRTNARPGKPLILACRDRALAFGLPGNPLAHFVCLNLYVHVALAAWSGRPTAPVFRPGVLTADLDAEETTHDTFWPACCRCEQGVASLTPLRWRSSGDLTALATANALIRVPAAGDRLVRGARIEYAPTNTQP